MELFELCYGIYEDQGQFAVYDYIEKYHPEVPWKYCEPCEILSPVDSENNFCLVCGSVIDDGDK